MADFVTDLPTPALCVDIDVLDRNLAHADALVKGTGKTLRPHFKTHRTPAIALRQLGSFVSGLTCATVGEADVLVQTGVSDVLIANEIVAPAKLQRVAQLARRARIIVAVDAAEAVQRLAQAVRAAGVTVDVLIDLDIGLGRCGVRGTDAVRALASEIASADGVRLVGLMGYEGRIRASAPDRQQRIRAAYALLAEAKQALETIGHEISIVSAAGTATLLDALRSPVVTEIQAGTYALMEPDVADLGLPFECAVYAVGTVISRSPGQIVLDVGRRSVTYEYGLPLVLDGPGTVTALNDEHAVVSWPAKLPALGEQIRLRPTQIRTTFNLYDAVWIISGGHVVNVWPVTARGKS